MPLSSVKDCIGAKALPSMGDYTSKLFSSTEFIGVELEYEGLHTHTVQTYLTNLPSSKIIADTDYSLKFAGVELKFSSALNGSNIIEALETVKVLLKNYEDKVYLAGHRCSTHIHINVSDLTLPQLHRFLLFAYFCEPALMDVCASDRRDNVFSVGIDKLEDYTEVLYKISKGDVTFDPSTAKYRAIGLNSIYSLGSLEFRMFNGTTDMDQVLDWINFVQEIKHIAINAENVTSILTAVMSSSPLAVLQPLFKRKITLSQKSIDQMWDFARDFYASQGELTTFESGFTPFYLDLN
jgi:hypothetical protein